MLYEFLSTVILLSIYSSTEQYVMSSKSLTWAKTCFL